MMSARAARAASLLALRSLSTSRHYGIFSKINTKFLPTGSGLLDKLTEPQQDIVLQLKTRIREKKGISVPFARQSVVNFVESFRDSAADIDVVEYALDLLDKLKYESVSETHTEVSHQDPMLLNEIFDDEELFRIFSWICRSAKEGKLDIFDGRVATLVYPEMAALLMQSKKLSRQQQWSVRMDFGVYLLYKEFYSHFLQSITEFGEGTVPEDVLKVLKMAKPDLDTVFKSFMAVHQKGDVSNWIPFFLESYSSATGLDIWNTQQLEKISEEQYLEQFVSAISEGDFSTKITLLRLLMESKLEIGSALDAVLKQVQEIDPTIINNKDISTILIACSKTNQTSASVEKLIAQLTSSEPHEISKVAWDAVLSYKVGSSKAGFDSDTELLKLIEQVAGLKSEPQEMTFKEVNGQLVFDSSYSDEPQSFVDVNCVNAMLEAAVASEKSWSYIDSIIKYFSSVAQNTQTHAILLRRCILSKDRAQVAEYFQKSIDGGTLWTDIENKTNGNVLCECVKFLFASSNSEQELQEAFQFMTKVKNFIEDIDHDTINVALEKFLQFGFVGDGLELLNKEFISSEDKTTSKYFGKANEEDIFNLENGPLNELKIDLNNQPCHKIFNTLYSYLLSCEDYELAWVVYGNMHRCFINVPYFTYLESMEKFNSLLRPDISMLIFQQMKKLNRMFGLPPPGSQHYTYLLKSFGDMGYETGIIELHAMLKIEVAVDADIGLRNALLGAYMNLQDLIRTRDLFESYLAIPASNKNAINSDTINIMLQAHTYGGIQYTKEFWNNLSDIDYIPDASNYKQLVASHGYHGDVDGALKTLEEMEFNGFEVEPDIIKEIYTRAEDEDKDNVRQRLLESKYSGMFEGLLEGTSESKTFEV